MLGFGAPGVVTATGADVTLSGWGCGHLAASSVWVIVSVIRTETGHWAKGDVALSEQQVHAIRARHHKMSNRVTVTVSATTDTRIGGGITARSLRTNKAYMTDWTATMQAPTVRFMARSLEGRSA